MQSAVEVAAPGKTQVHFSTGTMIPRMMMF